MRKTKARRSKSRKSARVAGEMWSDVHHVCAITSVLDLVGVRAYGAEYQCVGGGRKQYRRNRVRCSRRRHHVLNVSLRPVRYARSVRLFPHVRHDMCIWCCRSETTISVEARWAGNVANRPSPIVLVLQLNPPQHWASLHGYGVFF